MGCERPKLRAKGSRLPFALVIVYREVLEHRLVQLTADRLVAERIALFAGFGQIEGFVEYLPEC